MTYSSFLFQNVILGMTNSKTLSSWNVMFERYVVMHFVYLYKFPWCHIPKGDHSTVRNILKHPDLPLLFCCLIPMKYVMNNNAYSEHMAKCLSYELSPHWNPLQNCVNMGTCRIKPSFNAREVSKLEFFFFNLKSGLNENVHVCRYTQFGVFGKTDTPKP